MFTFTPLLGARSGSPALQSLLEFEGGVKILIDVGWDVSFNAELLKELERWVPMLQGCCDAEASMEDLDRPYSASENYREDAQAYYMNL